MAQEIGPLSEEDTARIEIQRSWVRDHYRSEARHHYDSVEGKLKLLDAIVKENWIEPSETWKLQSLGVTFGDALVQKTGVRWTIVQDQFGRDPALHDPGTTIVIFPLTAISKRIERGERVNVYDLFAEACDSIAQLRAKLRGRPN